MPPSVRWLTEYCADILAKYLVGDDGKSAYQRLFGNSSHEDELKFGEPVVCRAKPTKDMTVVLDGRCRPWVWLARKRGSSIHRIAIDSKVVIEARAVHRVSSDERWSLDNVRWLQATPWAWTWPADVDEAPVVIMEPGLAPPPAAPVERPYALRQLYIKPADLHKHGFTSGCRRCKLMREGRSVSRTNHSLPCRQRIEAARRDDGGLRVQQAVESFAEAVAPQIEAADNQAQEEVVGGVPAPATAILVARHRGPEVATMVARRPVVDLEVGRTSSFIRQRRRG